MHLCRDVMECLAALGRQQEALRYQQLGLESLRLIYGSVEKYLENYYHRKGRLYAVGALYYYAGDVERARQYFSEIGKAPAAATAMTRAVRTTRRQKAFFWKRKAGFRKR